MIYGEETLYSNCCAEADRMVDLDGADYSDYGRCPKCKEPCEFIMWHELGEVV